MKYGFIGTGNMGGTLARVLCKQVDPQQVMLANRTSIKAEKLAQELGCTFGTNEELARTCDTIFLGVKPQMMADMLGDLREVLTAREEKPLLVSMAAGLTMDAIDKMAGGGFPVVRIMPNTACTVGEGMILYCHNEVATLRQVNTVLEALDRSGVLDELPENLMDAGSAVAGCGGAYVCLFLEALADGGVACGLPRHKARLYAAQMLKGNAMLSMIGGEHTGAMKDAICSPGGTTIAGVRALEQRGFRSAAMEAVIAAYERTQELKR